MERERVHMVNKNDEERVAIIRERFFYDGHILRYSATKDKAGSVSKNGYLMVTVKQKQFYVHRICWLLHTGSWPSTGIDHINSDKQDNSVTNLRPATHSQNGCNRLNSRNTSGCKNVYWSNKRNKWVIDISLNKKRVFHKIMDNYDEAVATAKLKMDELHGEYAKYD